MPGRSGWLQRCGRRARINSCGSDPIRSRGPSARLPVSPWHHPRSRPGSDPIRSTASPPSPLVPSISSCGRIATPLARLSGCRHCSWQPASIRGVVNAGVVFVIAGWGGRAAAEVGGDEVVHRRPGGVRQLRHHFRPSLAQFSALCHVTRRAV